LAVLQGDDETLAPRARALARLAVTLTARPWALTQEAVEDARRQGLDEDQLEAAIGVISMFNYFTRVADATGIDFDYPTALPAFEPDLSQVTAPRPDRPVASSEPAGDRRRPRPGGLRSAWDSWRACVLEADQPLSQRERRLLAAAAAEETADWAGAEVLIANSYAASRAALEPAGLGSLVAEANRSAVRTFKAANTASTAIASGLNSSISRESNAWTSCSAAPDDPLRRLAGMTSAP